jgi:hypothetical protein
VFFFDFENAEAFLGLFGLELILLLLSLSNMLVLEFDLLELGGFFLGVLGSFFFLEFAAVFEFFPLLLSNPLLLFKLPLLLS